MELLLLVLLWQDKFLKGVAKEDAKGGGRKKKSSEEEMAMKSVTGLSLRLNEFEKELFKNYQFEEKPASNQADRRADRNSKGRGGAADRRGKEATASFRPGLKKACAGRRTKQAANAAGNLRNGIYGEGYLGMPNRRMPEWDLNSDRLFRTK